MKLKSIEEEVNRQVPFNSWIRRIKAFKIFLFHKSLKLFNITPIKMSIVYLISMCHPWNYKHALAIPNEQVSCMYLRLCMLMHISIHATKIKRRLRIQDIIKPFNRGSWKKASKRQLCNYNLKNN